MPEAKKCEMVAHPVYDRDALETQAEAQAMADAEAAPVPSGPDLDRSAVLAAADLQVMKVYVQEWGGFVHVRQLSGAERERLENTIRVARGKPGVNIRATFAAEVLCNPKGDRMFQAPGDVEILAGKSAKALDVVVEAAAGFNGLGAKDEEALRKN